MGKGTYGTTKGRPPKKKMTAKQKTLPTALQKKKDTQNLEATEETEMLMVRLLQQDFYQLGLW